MTFRDYWRAFFGAWCRGMERYTKEEMDTYYPEDHWIWANIAEYFTYK